MWPQKPPIIFPMRQDKPSPQFSLAIPNHQKTVSPRATVRLRAHGGPWSDKIEVLVDTGAIISVFTKSWCEIIGLELKKGSCVKLGTAGKSEVQVYIHTVDMQIRDEVLRDIHVGFREEEKSTSLLGMIDVFDSFEVNFRVRKLNTSFTRE